MSYSLIVGSFLLFLPAGLSNASPVLAKHIPLLKQWDAPIDGGITFRGKKLLGKNKTWRGLLFGTLIGGVSSMYILRFHITVGANVPSQHFWFGCLLGFGALFGDLIESFIKRQRNIAPGRTWFPFDQIDYIIAGLLISYPFIRLPIGTILIIVMIYFLLHLIVAYCGYLLGLKERPI